MSRLSFSSSYEQVAYEHLQIRDAFQMGSRSRRPGVHQGRGNEIAGSDMYGHRRMLYR